MAEFQHVIVGNSVAAIAAVEGIRSVDPRATVAIVSEEPYRAYSRPRISDVLLGQADADGIAYRRPDFYEANGVELLLGRRVTAIQPAEHRVELDNGESVTYGKLLLSPGGRPFRPPIPGLDLGGVFSFTTLDDARGLREAVLGGAKSAAVIGGGLIGLQAAEGLRKLGLAVSVVEIMDRLMAPAIDAYGSELIADVFRREGVELFTGAAAAEVLALAGKVTALKLKDGRELPADLVVVATGVIPRTELAQGTDIVVRRGIAVDDHMRTNVADIYAAGDVAEAYDLLVGEARAIPIWPNAYYEGRNAGKNMAGADTVYRGEIAMNAAHFFGFSIVSAGYFEPPGPEFIVQEEKRPNQGYYKRLIFRGEHLVGVVAAGAAIDRVGIATGLIKENIQALGLEDKLMGEFGLKILPQDLRWRRQGRHAK